MCMFEKNIKIHDGKRIRKEQNVQETIGQAVQVSISVPGLL